MLLISTWDLPLLAIKRRTLLTVLGTGSMAALGLPGFVWAGTEAGQSLRWLNAFRAADGHYGIAVFDGTGQLIRRTNLPERAHGAVATPDRRSFVVLARRPGRFGALIDAASGRVQTMLSATPGRHFYGHGVFSQDGTLFFTTENDFDGERGVIGIRNVNDGYRWLGEWPSYGIGPHELVLSADGRTLIVANGGILTHPDSGRAKLNIASMEPSLVKLDAQTGQLLEQQALEPALRWLSIRHIAVSVAGDVVFGMQNQGPPDPELPVAGIWRATGGLELLHHTSSLRQGYIGSVALDRSGTIAATSAPRDDKILFWRMRDGHMLTTVTLADGCGIAAAEQARSFWLSSGDGVLHKVSLERDVLQLTQSVTLPLQWDNHMATL